VNYFAGADELHAATKRPGTVVRIYDAAAGGHLLASAVSEEFGRSEKQASATFPVAVATLELPHGFGSLDHVYVSLTEPGQRESARTAKAVPPAPPAPAVDDIAITNREAGDDLIEVHNVPAGADVMVYAHDSDRDDTLAWSCNSGEEAATLSLPVAGGFDESAESVYVAVLVNGAESRRTLVAIPRKVSEVLDRRDIIPFNFARGNDEIQVFAPYNSKIKVYEAETGGEVLAEGLANDPFALYANPALRTSDAYAKEPLYRARLAVPAHFDNRSTVYVSLTKPSQLESPRTAASVLSTPNAPAPDDIQFTPVPGGGYELRILNVPAGMGVAVYDTVDSRDESGSRFQWEHEEDGSILLNLSSEDVTGGYFYVAVLARQLGDEEPVRSSFPLALAESPRVEVAIPTYPTIPTTLAQDLTFVDLDETEGEISGTLRWNAAVNESEIDDYAAYFLDAEGLKIGDPIGIVPAGTNCSITLAEDTAIPDGATQFGIYSVNVAGESETPSTAAIQDRVVKEQSLAPDELALQLINFAIGADEIQVLDAPEGSRIRVYDAEADGDLLGTAVSQSLPDEPDGGSHQVARLTLENGFSDLSSVYVTVTEPNKRESIRVQAMVPELPAAPATDDIQLVNNATGADLIEVRHVQAGDRVRVYTATDPTVRTVFVEAENAGTEESTVSIPVPSGFDDALTDLQVAILSPSGGESLRKQKTIPAASQAPEAPTHVTITVTNTDAYDEVTVTHVPAGATVLLYAHESDEDPIGSAQNSSANADTITAEVPHQFQPDWTHLYVVIAAGTDTPSRTAVEIPAETIVTAQALADINAKIDSGTAEELLAALQTRPAGIRGVKAKHAALYKSELAQLKLSLGVNALTREQIQQAVQAVNDQTPPASIR
jgi:hypothetical protein